MSKDKFLTALLANVKGRLRETWLGRILIWKRDMIVKPFSLLRWHIYKSFFRPDMGAPIFIVGCGHSGTSLTLAILGAHSNLFAVPFESMAFRNPNRARRAIRQFDQMAVKQGKKRWVEKTPRHVYCIGTILSFFPDAKILLITRDGRDVAVSLAKRFGSLEEGIQRWVSDNLAAVAYWQHPNVYRFRYEDLVSDTRGTLNGILGFLGEAYESNVERHFEKPNAYYSDTIEKPDHYDKSTHQEYRNWQMNQPVYDARGHWKNLSSDELGRIEPIGRDMLTQLAYLQKEPGPRIETTKK